MIPIGTSISLKPFRLSHEVVTTTLINGRTLALHMARERGESGQFVKTVTKDRILGVFERVRGPVVTSSDVADQLDCTTNAAREGLAELHEQGLVERRKTGRTVVWWLVDEEHDAPAAPLRDLVGLIGDEGVDRVRERSREIRESMDTEVGATRREVASDRDE